jgi:hypothetical protein
MKVLLLYPGMAADSPRDGTALGVVSRSWSDLPGATTVALRRPQR